MFAALSFIVHSQYCVSLAKKKNLTNHKFKINPVNVCNVQFKGYSKLQM